MNVQDDSARDLRSLARWRATARVLVEALPFILAYDNKTIYITDGTDVYVTKDDGSTWKKRDGTGANVLGLSGLVAQSMDDRDRRA